MGFRESVERRLRDVADEDSGSVMNEGLGDREPDPAGTSRDEHALSREPCREIVSLRTAGHRHSPLLPFANVGEEAVKERRLRVKR